MAKERTGYTYQDNNGRWYARITFTNEQGTRRDIKRSAKDEKEANKALKALVRELEENGERSVETASMGFARKVFEKLYSPEKSGLSPLTALHFSDNSDFSGKAASMTFADLAEHYITHYLQEATYINDRKVSGVRARANALLEVKPLVSYFGNRKLRSITYRDLRSFKQSYLGTKTKRGETRTLASVNRTLSRLRRMLNIAFRERWIPRNPFSTGESLISAADEIPRSRILARDEETRLLTRLDQPKRRHILGITLIALDCALRRGEILTLRWNCVDLQSRTLTVTAFNSKTARARTVAMTIRVYEWLQSRRSKYPAQEDALVFGGIKAIKRGFMAALKEAEIKDFHFHDCRASAISRMIQCGIAPAEVMRVSGHTTLSCLNRYIRADLNTVFRAASALDTYLAQASETQATNAPELIN